MTVTRLEVYFEGSGYISDRTARDTIRSVSRAMRRAQSQEIIEILKRLELPLDRFQSARDLCFKYLETAPLLDIERAEQGSWKITALVGALGIWFLSNTVGESIKEGWSKSDMNDIIIDFVEQRADFLAGYFDSGDAETCFDGRWTLAKVTITPGKKAKTIKLYMKNSDGVRTTHAEFITDRDVIKALKN